MPLSPPSVEPDAAARKPFGLGSFAVAGFIGGPLAAVYLAARNRMNCAPSSRESGALLAFYIVATVAWFWSLFNGPPDALSQLIMHVPQVALWLLVTWPLLRRSFAAYARAGGAFRSLWVATGIGFLAAVGLRLLLWLLFA